MFRSRAEAFKIQSSYVIGALALFFCLYAAATEGSNPILQILICVLGGSIGWCLGLYITPTNESEKKTLSDAGKTIITLLSGVGLGKIQEISHTLNAWFPSNENETGLRILLFACTVIIGALFTYISRLFVKGPDEELRRERQKAIEELRLSIAKLEANS